MACDVAELERRALSAQEVWPGAGGVSSSVQIGSCVCYMAVPCMHMEWRRAGRCGGAVVAHDMCIRASLLSHGVL